MSPVNSVSLDSGPLCPGQTAVLTCNVPGGITLQWIYNSMEIFTIQGTSVPSSDPIPVEGVEFTVSLLSNTGSDLVSEISFEVSSSINGGVLRCAGLNATAVVNSEVTLQKEDSVGELETTPTHCRKYHCTHTNSYISSRSEACAKTFYTSHYAISPDRFKH